jgi:hypothetical protein
MDLDDLDLSLDMEPDVDATPPEAVEPSIDELSMDFDLEPSADTDEAESSRIPRSLQTMTWICL